MKKLIIALVLPLLFISCSALTGEEIARLKINKISTKGKIYDDTKDVELKQGDEIMFWSDLDLAYEGDVKLRFRVKIFKNGEKFKELEIDPFKKNITLGETKTVLMGKTNWSFTGKNMELKIEDDGTYTIGAILIAGNNPSITIEKAELIIKK